MKNNYHNCDLSDLTFLVTGGAGFIGSHLTEYLLISGAKKVIVFDNLSTGNYTNIKEFEKLNSFQFINGDIRNINDCQAACSGVDYVLHQAALGSVPRSINDPITTNAVNIDGFLNMLVTVRDNKVKRIVFAASSSTYGDCETLPMTEDNIGKPLSPYAVTKYVNELYAHVFAQTYGIETIGLRYFNVFGPKQDPKGAYAAVIPLFINAVIQNQSPIINGNGEQTRDFTYVENVVQANIKALFVHEKQALNQIYNVACGEQTSLNQLFHYINELCRKKIACNYGPNRRGDLPKSWADISKAREFLLYTPVVNIKEGLMNTIDWFKTLSINI